MNKLLQLLGQEKYDKLKAAMGADFDAFKKQFENDEIKEADIEAKLKELNITEDATGDGTDETGDGTDGGDTGTGNNETGDNETGDSTSEPDISAVLEDGWLVDGKVDVDKIIYEPLKEYVVGLQNLVKEADWAAKYKIAVLSEALKQGMYDIDDANRFISLDSLSIDADGNVIGVKEAFDKLRGEKPHLFKPLVNGGKSPVDNGFNPVDGKVTGKPRSYAEAIEQTRALQV